MKFIDLEMRKKKYYKSYKKGGPKRCCKEVIVISRTSSPVTSASYSGRVLLSKGGKIK